MGKEAGYVYFEADCTSNGLNPFVPLDSVNPTLAAFQQKPLKVVSFFYPFFSLSYPNSLFLGKCM